MGIFFPPIFFGVDSGIMVLSWINPLHDHTCLIFQALVVEISSCPRWFLLKAVVQKWLNLGSTTIAKVHHTTRLW